MPLIAKQGSSRGGDACVPKKKNWRAFSHRQSMNAQAMLPDEDVMMERSRARFRRRKRIHDTAEDAGIPSVQPSACPSFKQTLCRVLVLVGIKKETFQTLKELMEECRLAGLQDCKICAAQPIPTKRILERLPLHYYANIIICCYFGVPTSSQTL
jgi:hypothetical protein